MLNLLQARVQPLVQFGFKLLPMAVPLALGGGWFIYPALTENFKKNPFGIYGDLEDE